MKKLLAVLLSIMMLAMPLTSMAENSVWDKIAPEPVRYTLSVSLTLYKNADADAVKKRAQVSLAAHAEALRADLGRDVVRSQFIDAALVSGVYDVEIVSPAADVILTRKQWADCTGITVNIEGRADG